MNENYGHPSPPPDLDSGGRENILAGMHRLPGAMNDAAQIQLLGSGAILCEVMAAQALLKADWDITAAVWSVTSFTELQRNGIAVERAARLSSKLQPAPHVTSLLDATRGPVVAATDYVRALPELIRAFVPRRYVTLGTDGFGRSDTRRALRSFFEVDRESIVIAALKALVDDGAIKDSVLRAAVKKYGRAEHAESEGPWRR